MPNDPLASLGGVPPEGRQAIADAQQNGGTVRIREAQNDSGSYRREIVVTDHDGNVQYSQYDACHPVSEPIVVRTDPEFSGNAYSDLADEVPTPAEPPPAPKRYLVDQEYGHLGEMFRYDAEHITSLDELANPASYVTQDFPSLDELGQIGRGTRDGFYESGAETIDELKGTHDTVKKVLTDAEYRQDMMLLAERIYNDPGLISDAIENGLIEWNDEIRAGWEQAKATGTQTEFLAKFKTKMQISVAKMFIPGGAGVKILNKVASKCPKLAKLVKKLGKVFGKADAPDAHKPHTPHMHGQPNRPDLHAGDVGPPPPPHSTGAGGGGGKSPHYIPLDEHGNPIPLPQQNVGGVDIPTPHPHAQGPHTVLGGRVGQDGVLYRQSATFPGETWPKADGQDVPWGRVDWHDHSRPDVHSNPHIHPLEYDWQRRQWREMPLRPFHVPRSE